MWFDSIVGVFAVVKLEDVHVGTVYFVDYPERFDAHAFLSLEAIMKVFAFVRVFEDCVEHAFGFFLDAFVAYFIYVS